MTVPGRLRSARPDAGMTLMELTVAMAVTGLLAVVVGSLFTGLNRSFSFTSGTIDTTAEARVATDAITQTLRAAVPAGADSAALYVASPDRMSFYASLDRSGGTVTPVPPVLVAFTWNGTDCVTRTLNGSVPTCILRTTKAPEFSYYTTVDGTAPMDPAPGTTLTLRRTVKSVGITLFARKAVTGSTAVTEVRDRVTLTNCLTLAC